MAPLQKPLLPPNLTNALSPKDSPMASVDLQWPLHLWLIDSSGIPGRPELAMAIHGNDWMMTQNNLPRTQDRQSRNSIEILMTKSKMIEEVKAMKLRERIKIRCNTKIKELRGNTQAKI